MDDNKPKGRPGELVIGTSMDNILVTIAKDGTLTYGPGYTPDAAAKMFWEALAKRRDDYEERLVFITHIEKLMARIGEQDMRAETARMQAAETKTPHDEFQAERALGQLEVLVHEMIELARGIALRDRNNKNAPPEPGTPPNIMLN